MANKRIFYACYKAGIAPYNSTNFTTIRGLQQLGMTTTFNLTQVFELGQLAIYENIEGIPDVEATLEKVLDGYAPIYLLATQANSEGEAPDNASLVGRSQGICCLGVVIADETAVNADGTKVAEAQLNGMYISQVGYRVNVNDNASESVNMVGNNKVWVIGTATGSFLGGPYSTGTYDTPWASGQTSPKSVDGSGGVNRREDVLFGSGSSASYIPVNIPGVTVVNGSGYNILTSGVYGVHIQSWESRVNLGREELFELGRRGTYYRFVKFPTEVTTEIGVITSQGDGISATEDGIFGSTSGCGGRYNLTDNRIRLCLCEGLIVDVGSKNKLQSVGVSGGGADGGNMEVTYTYTNFNEFTVKHPADPVVALRP